MGFDLYFAGSPNAYAEQQMLNRGVCRLYSQLNDRKLGQQWLDHNKEHHNTKVFVDSGAFTAWTQGKQLDIDEYINYLNANTNELTLFASVDNIPGKFRRLATLKEKQQSPILSWKNYMYMRERVVDKDKLLPVFHIGEDFKHLNNMCNIILDGKHIPYIALGGTVGLNATTKDNWYKQCFKIIKQSNNPNVKVHAFGMTSTNILENFPFNSADSTSWLMTANNGNIITRYGVVCVSNVGEGKPNHLSILPDSAKVQIKKDLAKHNIELGECIESYQMRWVANMHFMQDWADSYKYKGNNRYQKRLF